MTLKELREALGLDCSLPAIHCALTGLLQLAAFCFRTIKSWSGFAGDF